MFDFQKLTVYQKAKGFVNATDAMLTNETVDKNLRDQMHRASVSIMLNIAEGSARMSKKDRRNFYGIARGSAYECVAVLDILSDRRIIALETYNAMFGLLEEISKMLWAMIRNLED